MFITSVLYWILNGRTENNTTLMLLSLFLFIGCLVIRSPQEKYSPSVSTYIYIGSLYPHIQPYLNNSTICTWMHCHIYSINMINEQAWGKAANEDQCKISWCVRNEAAENNKSLVVWWSYFAELKSFCICFLPPVTQTGFCFNTDTYYQAGALNETNS